jgi:hypothetical protein
MSTNDYQNVHTGIFSILLLLPGALLLILFKNGFSTGKAQCALWLAETRAPVTVQRMFRAPYGKNPPDVKLILSWKAKFLETGSIHKGNIL